MTRTASERLYIGVSPMVKKVLPGFKISRAVRAGRWLFTNGQMDLGDNGKVLNPGDIVAQTMTCMRSVYEVVAKADCRLAELAQLQIFYLAGSVPDEPAYRAQIIEEFPEVRDALIVMTPVPSFATIGSEVEIDAIACKGDRETVTDQAGVVRGVRRGNWVFANDRVCGEAQIVEGLRVTLERLGCGLGDVCRLYAYYPDSLGLDEREAIQRKLAEAFMGVFPAYHATLVPVAARPELMVELEVIAHGGGAGEVIRKGRAASPVVGLEWPFADVVQCAGVAFTSGQFPLNDAATVEHRGNIADQARLVMQHLDDRLALVDAGMAQLVKIKTYYEGAWDQENWFDNLRARMERLSDPGPASSGIEGLPAMMPDALLSVDGIAVLDDRSDG